MWIVLAFTSAALLGFYDVFKKHALTANAVLPVLFFNTLFCSIIFLPFIVGSLIGLFSDNSIFYIPLCGWYEHKYLLFKAVLVLSSWLTGYLGVKHLPITITGPISATRPIMTLVGALLIYGENLNLLQWLGVLLAIISFFLLNHSGKKEGIQFIRNKWVYLIVLAAILGAASGLYDKYLVSPIESGGLGFDKLFVQSWNNLYQTVLMGGIVGFLWWPKRAKTTPFKWRWSILGISVFLTIADVAYFYALTFPDTMISVVSMVRRSSVVVSFFVGAFIFKEKNLKAKSLDLILVLLAMLLIWLGTNS